MSYHDLSECTLSDDERMKEANELIGMINTDEISEKENDFVCQIATNQRCSVKQLFWLRDIKDKYL